MIAVFNLHKVTDGAILISKIDSEERVPKKRMVANKAWVPKKLITDVDGVLEDITPTTPLDPMEPIELELPDWLADQKGLS